MEITTGGWLLALGALVVGIGIAFLVNYIRAERRKAQDASREQASRVADLEAKYNRLKASRRTPEGRKVELTRAAEDIVRLQVMSVTDGLDVLHRMDASAYVELLQKLMPHLKGEG